MSTPDYWFESNIAQLEAEKNWLTEVIQFRIAMHLGLESPYASIEEIPIPELPEEGGSPFSFFILSKELSPFERLVLILALAPHLFPSALDQLLRGFPDNTPVAEYGGFRGQVHKGLIPTVQTALFIIAGTDLSDQILLRHILTQDHLFVKENWIRIEQLSHLEPGNSALILAGKELIEMLTTGRMGEPEFGPTFPAQKIETDREWDDLILPHDTKNDIQDIIAWITHEKTVMQDWGLGEKVSPGFRCLFHGPPGTGKTFTATLLGKATGRDVYRIDLSMVVSKYIGETEKNLKVVFDKAQSRDWILFFDEADALFGKRTDVSDSKDRYANQEVSYLLQRVESFDGVVILATNNRENMDKAFTRRFQLVVNFPMPNPTERLRLWETGMPESCELAPSVNLLAIADRYEMAGGSIMNVIRHCALRAAMRGAPIIEEFDLLDGIRREFRKAGRILN